MGSWTPRLRTNCRSLAMFMPTNYDSSSSLITFQLRLDPWYYHSLLLWFKQPTQGAYIGISKTFRKVTEECCMKVQFLKIWYGLCWTFPLLICLYFHFQADNTQAELKHSDISAILFWVHCDFLSSAEIEGDWIKQKLQNLELVITIQMDFL